MNVLDDAVEEKLLMNEAPSSLAESYDIDLSKWSVIVTDNTFKRIAHYNRRKTEEAKTNRKKKKKYYIALILYSINIYNYSYATGVYCMECKTFFR